MALQLQVAPSSLNSSFSQNILDQSQKGTWRGLFGDWFNATNISAEDYARDLEKMRITNEFNANEAEKNRQWQERLSNTAIQRAVNDMKTAGINPIMAYSQGGASTPSGGVASGSSFSSKSTQANTSDFIQLGVAIAQICAGMYASGAKNATALQVANTTRKSENYSQVLHLGSRKFKK